jgi:uncharacterized protein
MSALVPPIQPIHFGMPDRRLFGIFHPATASPAQQAGVVVCNAFGQEAIRAHRMMRVLAERLARAGHCVLRFDYFGTGDSLGDDLDGDLDGWASDVRAANRELHERAGASNTIWIGMRLGATVAVLAARDAPDELARLILWDPVIDGERYLRHLRERHVASLEAAFSLMPRPAPSVLARDPTQFRDEAIGFAQSPSLQRQVGNTRTEGFRWPPKPASIVVLTDPDDPDGKDVARVCEREPDRVRRVSVVHHSDWTTDTANDTALVPAAAMLQIVEQAGARP